MVVAVEHVRDREPVEHDVVAADDLVSQSGRTLRIGYGGSPYSTL